MTLRRTECEDMRTKNYFIILNLISAILLNKAKPHFVTNFFSPGPQTTAVRASLAVIRCSTIDRIRPVNLLENHHESEFMLKGERRQRPAFVR